MKLDRMVGKVIDDEAIATYLFAVVIQRRAEVVAPVARGESVVLVESAVVGMVRRLRSVVPLSERAGRVAGRFETNPRWSSRPDSTFLRRD